MCVAIWLWQSHPLYPFLLLLNRDEYLNRPTDAVSWWEDHPTILGGRDCVAGGTWLACSRNGRIAFVTNFQEPHSRDDAKSRGDLPTRFLESGKSPLEFALEVQAEGDQYNGFNLILADLHAKSMIYISNRPKGQPTTIQEVSPGCHVQSNASLDAPWPKVQRLRRKFDEFLEHYGDQELPDEEMVLKLMTDTEKAARENLPKNGLSEDWLLELSSISINTNTEKGRYCTRSTVALFVKESGEVTFYERYLEDDTWKEKRVNYNIEE